MKRKLSISMIILSITFSFIMNVYSDVKNPFKAALPEIDESIEVTPPKIKLQRELPRPTRPIDRPKLPPIAPVHPAPSQSPELNITGLIWNTDRPQAIINNQVVDIGDTITEKGIQIISIMKTGIEVLIQGNKMTIKP